jgi:hypothetical protein
VKLNLGPFWRCLLCAEQHLVESAMRMVHLVAAHPVLAICLVAENADVSVLFDKPPSWN